MTSFSDATLEQLDRRAGQVGLALRGACHTRADELLQLARQVHQGTLVLLGFTADRQWPMFERSPEANDGLPHPLDRWSRRVIGGLADEFDAQGIYPDDLPIVPFQQLAMRCECVYPSPVGVLIHPLWGLWHAYRGGLVFSMRLDLPSRS
jgi:hypothetical protein